MMYVSVLGMAAIGLAFYIVGWLAGRSGSKSAAERPLSEAARIELRKYEIDRQAECIRYGIDENLRKNEQEK